MNLSTFELPYEKYLLKGDSYSSGAAENNTIVLHGAGKSSRATFSRLREYLCLHGISSASFDFVGHGETGGSIQETTLQGRTDQAAAAIKHTCQEPLNLIAASMAGYSAIKLTELFTVENLVLLVPAVYTPHACDILFGPDFSAIIRERNSWVNSDAFGTISEFDGSVTIIAAEFDDVIPKMVIEQLYASARNAEKRTLHIVPNSSHLSLFPQEKDFREVMDLLLEVLNNRRSTC